RDARQAGRRPPRAVCVRHCAGRKGRGSRRVFGFGRGRTAGCATRGGRVWLRSNFLLPGFRKDICENLARRKESTQPPRKSISQGARFPCLRPLNPGAVSEIKKEIPV